MCVDAVTLSTRLVRQMIQDNMDDLTRSERQLASVLLQDYPMGGLQSITKLAASAAVSTPTVIRMARKLGFDGFPALQEALREEVAAQIKKPITKRDAWMADASAEHPLNRFAGAVAANIRHTLDRIDIAMFDAVARLLADLRRYERHLETLAGLASDRGCKVVLFTDQWGSPVARRADYTFSGLVEAPSSWDSTIAIMLIVEALIAEVQAARWDDARERIEELEAMFSSTRLFRSPT